MECLHCKNTNNSLMACGDCKKAVAFPDDPPIAHYCNAACQRADWKQHKGLCQRLRDRTQVFRVGELAQRLFYQYRELTWSSLDIQAIVAVGDDRHLKSTEPPMDGVWPRDYRVFPRHLLLNKRTKKKDREAILSFLASKDAVSWVLEFIEGKGLLKELVSSVDEIRCTLKNAPMEMSVSPTCECDCHRHQGIKNNRFQHRLMKIKLHSGESFALDLAGAQYGFLEAVMKWEDYEDTRIESSSVYPAHEPEYSLKVDDCTDDTQVQHKINLIPCPSSSTQDPILKVVNKYILLWQGGTKCSLKNIWRMGVDEYKENMEKLLDYIEFGISLEFKGLPCYTVKGQELQKRTNGVWNFAEN